MTIYEFRLLTHQQMCDIVFKEGIYISARINDELTYNLYSISTFFAEIGFHLHYNYLDRIVVFNSTKLLEPYLEEIQISLED